MTRTTPSGPMRISARARRNRRLHDPIDRKVVDPLQIEIAQVLNPDPEIIQDPPVRLALPASGSAVSELVEQQAEDVSLREVVRQRQGADRVRPVEGVHQAALADLPGIHLPEQDDLAAADVELRPGQLLLRLRDEAADHLERDGQPAPWWALTG